MRTVFLPAGALLALALNLPAAAGEARCHYTYGGETRTLTVAPSAMPYMVPAHSVGSRFRLRFVLETEPHELAALKAYVYADRDGAPVLVHQGEWPWPAGGTPAPRHGFTGLQRAYEPTNDGELIYWCTLAGADAAAASEAERAR
jgi:catechol 2,3-dioxygenase-like lactoylglutathione lyase family enzyme